MATYRNVLGKTVEAEQMPASICERLSRPPGGVHTSEASASLPESRVMRTNPGMVEFDAFMLDETHEFVIDAAGYEFYYGAPVPSWDRGREQERSPFSCPNCGRHANNLFDVFARFFDPKQPPGSKTKVCRLCWERTQRG